MARGPECRWRMPDGSYTIGIRPHHITPAARNHGTATIEGRVLVTELRGSESVLHFDLNGQTWVSQSHGIHPFAVGSTAKLYVDVGPELLLRCRRQADCGERLMAKITLDDLRHSYYPNPAAEDDWALKKLSLDWEDGGAYALLGPSGCGKTTLLNLISGLLRPTEGRILFDGQDVTEATPEQRNIAQVFQFPVIYDTMTVYDNLAFPLRNRGVAEAEVDKRVREIAEMLDLDHMLDKRASGLTADGKQKISLGRGLVRSDVNVIMFDEPLTVIDPASEMGAALEAEGAASPHPAHHDLCHPRPDRGADLRRPGGGDEQWRGGADRHAGRPVRAAEAYLRRPFHRFARHERAALRRRKRQGHVRRPARSKR